MPLANPTVDENGLMELQPISGNAYTLYQIPKDFLVGQNLKCVFRQSHFDELKTKLENCVAQPSRPGVFVQGPAGGGKSMLTYVTAQVAKHCWKWFTVYIPNCKQWTQSAKPAVAMGFFLDRVKEAFIDSFQTDFQAEYGILTNIPVGSRDWENAALTNETAVESAFTNIVSFLKDNHDGTTFLLVFDEVNALWSDKNDFSDQQPWNLVLFSIHNLWRGAKLVSGTTDGEFLQSIPIGMARPEFICYVGRFSEPELDSLLETQMGQPLKKIKELDLALYSEIQDACGGIPREITHIISKLEDFASLVDASTDEPVRKKLKLDTREAIRVHRGAQYEWHVQAIMAIIERDLEKNLTVFRDQLLSWCKDHFLFNKERVVQRILRLPNFVISDKGMHPTTLDAMRSLFNWFTGECNKLSVGQRQVVGEVVTNLKIVADKNADGGDRGNAFEKYLTVTITMLDNHRISLKYHVFGESGRSHAMDFDVRDRVFADTGTPPTDFRHLRQGTLLSHTGQSGGEARIDMIYYTLTDVYFFELTVGNYRSKKLPVTNDREGSQGRTDLILAALCKWLGNRIYTVGIDREHDQPKLVADYLQTYTSRSNMDRPNVPTLHYIVVTTCPQTVQPAYPAVEAHRWIKVCFLEDLIEAGLIPESQKDNIIRAQANDAGRA